METKQQHTLEDFLEFSNGELQYYLQQRGLSSSGNHGYLAARALIAHEQNIEIVATAKQISDILKIDYSKILKTYNINFDPLTADGFDDDVKNWPATNIGHVFSYFLESKAFETEYIGQYKLRKAYSFFGSGFVEKVYIKKANNMFYARSSVTPSQRIREKQHQLWILFNSDGSIVTAFCTCTAGQSKFCNHIAAVLYKIEFANQRGLNSPACTDESCVWNASAKEIGPMKVKDMNIVEHNRSKRKEQTKFLNYKEKLEYDPRPESMREVLDEDKNAFLAKVREIVPKATINTAFTPPTDSDIPSSLIDIATAIKNTAADTDKVNMFGEKLSFNDDQLHELEKATRRQSNSRHWWDQRKGRITASRFHEVHQKVNMLHKNRAKPVKCKVTPLLLSFVEPTMLRNGLALEWGKKNETHAAESFMQQEGKKHAAPKLLFCGLFIYKSHPYVGATPDNIFKCNCCEPCCVEYKCPFSIRDEEISTSWKKTDFLENVNGHIQLKRSHKYYTQVTGQMAITGCNRTYFVVYTKKDLLIELIEFDNAHWMKILSSLIIFFKTYIQRYMLGIIEMFVCPICDQPCLNENEFESEEENSVQCDL